MHGLFLLFHTAVLNMKCCYHRGRSILLCNTAKQLAQPDDLFSCVSTVSRRDTFRIKPMWSLFCGMSFLCQGTPKSSGQHPGVAVLFTGIKELDSNTLQCYTGLRHPCFYLGHIHPSLWIKEVPSPLKAPKSVPIYQYGYFMVYRYSNNHTRQNRGRQVDSRNTVRSRSLW